MNPPLSDLPAAATVAVIGAGRLGGVLAAALRNAGLTVQGPLRRGDEIPDVDIALLCVPDAAITDAARTARRHALFTGHVSGATPLDDVDFSLHPLQTFTGSELPEVFQGIGCAIDARTDAALTAAADLVEVLGARAFHIDDAHRAAYHAAASLASNLLLTVLDAAEQVAAASGPHTDEARALLAPLVQQSVANWKSAGARAALTGPIARGDEQTVARQRSAIVDARPEIAALFDELCESTRALAARPLAPTEVSRAEGSPTEVSRAEADAA